MKRPLFALFLFLFALGAQAEIVGKEVDYRSGGTVFKGYLAYDDEIDTKRPGVLVVHEWWGHNDYARGRARQLAELGYVALAVDMYGEGKQADHPKEAGKFSAAVKANMDEAEARFRAALDLLSEQPNVNRTDIGAIGYCFGGGIVLEMARRGLPLDAVASFHGSLTTDHPVKPGEIKGYLYVANGADDPLVKPEDIEAFNQEMQAAGVNYSFQNFPGAKHAFTNPKATELGKKFGLPLAYNAEADRLSWRQMLRLFDTAFASFGR